MSNEKGESTELREKVAALEKEVRTLREVQEKKKWIHEHHILGSIIIGIVLAILSATIVYAILWALPQTTLSGWLYLVVFLIVPSLVPFIVFIPLISYVRSPAFSVKSYTVYVFSVLLADTFLVLADPFRLPSTPVSVTGLVQILIVFIFIQFLPLAVLSAVVNILARYFGYRVVLQGATLSFEGKSK